MFGLYFRTMVPKAQTNQNRVSQERLLEGGHHFKPSGLLSGIMWLSFNFPRSVNPGIAGSVAQGTDTSLLS